MAFGINYFATTGLMIYLSLIGNSNLAADIAIVQASTTALFYAFSGNARSLILNLKSSISASNILAIRLALLFPLGIASIFLSTYISNVAWIFAALLILRKGGEWLTEVYISDSEVSKKFDNARNYFILQCVMLLLVFLSIHINNSYFYIALLVWSVSPIVYSAIFLHEKLRNTLFHGFNLARLSPNFGSTAVIGVGVYVFRLVLLSLVDKPVAGDLFAAFAVGGIFGSIFYQALGPSLVGNDALVGKAILLKVIHSINLLLVFLGIVLISISWDALDAILIFGKSGLFVNAVGFSLIGGALMIYAQYWRLKILQQYENSEVYGPDILINILLVASVPFLYYIFGYKVLPCLFLISAGVNFIFYYCYMHAVRKNTESIITFVPIAFLKYFISFLIVTPIFFQLGSGIFNEKPLVFDTKGLLFNLPIPLSVFACMFGFIILNEYKKCRSGLTVVLFVFIFMVISTVFTTYGEIKYQQSKMILMMQFIIPLLALVSGQLIYKKVSDLKIIAKSFLFVGAVLIPSQLIITWLEGGSLLVSYMYLFSFYQHLQYGSVIIVSAFLFSLFVLNDDPKYRVFIYILLPFVGLYAVASTSRTAILLLSLGLAAIFSKEVFNKRSSKKLFASVILTIICASLYFSLFINENQITSGKFSSPVKVSVSKENMHRSYYWKYYVDGIFDDMNSSILGHKERPDRNIYPSAHNYYLDITYNFGFISLIPILYLIVYTLRLIFTHRKQIVDSTSLLGITYITLFLIIIDNSLKVGFRQPYPGIYSFFLWGLLLGVMHNLKSSALKDKVQI